jgi:hypothetical protein
VVAADATQSEAFVLPLTDDVFGLGDGMLETPKAMSSSLLQSLGPRRPFPMLANMTTVTSDRADLNEGAKMAAEALLPWVRQFDGYRGIVVLSDGDNGKAHFLTFWEDEHALQKSEFGRAQVREQMAKTAGVEIESVQAYNVIVSDGVE